jgi:low affinity Fe/Cu permease
VKKLKTAVFRNQKTDIDDLNARLREFTDDFSATKSRVFSMEDNLPKIIREMISFYVDQKFEKRFDLFATKEELK